MILGIVRFSCACALFPRIYNIASDTGAKMSLKFPEELLQPPRCLIAISGLDVRNNAVHRAVWDEFTQGGRRNERKPVLYRNMPPDHLYPKASDPVSGQ